MLSQIYKKGAKTEHEEKVNKYAGLENVTREIIAAGIVDKSDIKEILDIIVTKLPKNKVCLCLHSFILLSKEPSNTLSTRERTKQLINEAFSGSSPTLLTGGAAPGFSQFRHFVITHFLKAQKLSQRTTKPNLLSTIFALQKNNM